MGRQPVRKSGSYNRLTRRILSGVRGGSSRSEFLADLFDGLASNSSSDGYVLLVEGFPDSDRNLIRSLQIPLAFGPSSHRISNFQRELTKLSESPFVYSLLAHHREHQFVLRSYAVSEKGLGDVRYNDEFRTLHGVDETWICALPLRAKERGEPERSLLAFYPTSTENGSLGLPPGAEAEWDSLEIIPDIFMVLQNRVRSLQEQVEEEQRQIISDLAPSAIAHEMGTNLNLILSALARITGPLRGLIEQVGEENDLIQQVIDELLGVRSRALKAQSVASAFTNLQRKVPRSEAVVLELIDEIEIVLAQRLGGVGISLVTQVDPELTIETDVRFLEHVLMNVIMNAIEAIEPEVERLGGGQEVNVSKDSFDPEIRILVVEQDAQISFIVANNGPAIPPEISPRVFEQGVTTKPSGTGHGHGLHLCRQIAVHLGGKFGFGSFPEQPEFKPNVVFDLSLPANASHPTDS